MRLYEYKCVDCKEVILLNYDKEPDTCPYCMGDLDYTPGRIEPVLTYTPRSKEFPIPVAEVWKR